MQQRTVRRRPTRRLPASGRPVTATHHPLRSQQDLLRDARIPVFRQLWYASLPAPPLHPRGYGSPPATAIQNFARQVAEIKKDKLEPVMRVGRLDTARDFIDVRDGVEGMLQMLEKGRAGEPVNICNQKAHTIQEVLDILVEESGVDVDVEQDPALLRPSDEPLLLGDNSRLRALGWERRYTFRETLQTVYADWLARTPD